MITLIAAVDQNRGIGKNGMIPWHNFADMDHFKNETLGSAVIMGTRTWESLNNTCLTQRVNIIVGTTYLSHQAHTSLCYVPTVESAISLAKSMRSRIYGIGGEGIYEAMLPLADRILLSKIPGNYGCDTFFPSFQVSKWNSTDLSFPGLEVTEYLRKASQS